MTNFLHTFQPDPLLISFGPIRIYWYGLFVVSGILAAVYISLRLADKYYINKNKIIDLIFWSIIFGLIGARLYHVFLEFNYYISNPLDIFKIWKGGLAIHGGIIAGIITLIVFTRRNKLNPWIIGSIFVPGLALAQAIGRWGNYFNQELFGLPTNLPWGIPIKPISRLPEYYNYQFFHPTFIYESVCNLLIFTLLIWLHKKNIIKEKKYKIIVFSYLLSYSIVRFSLEFIRIDNTPEFIGLRWPQIVSLLIIIISWYYISKINKKSPDLPKA